MAMPWSQTPSGSRAPSRYYEEYEEEDEDEEGDDAFFQTEELSENALYQEYTLSAGSTLPPGVSFTQKLPPVFNGTGSWFAYEENVRDWVGITIINPDKHGPLLKNGLHGFAGVYNCRVENDNAEII